MGFREYRLGCARECREHSVGCKPYVLYDTNREFSDMDGSMTNHEAMYSAAIDRMRWLLGIYEGFGEKEAEVARRQVPIVKAAMWLAKTENRPINLLTLKFTEML